MWGIVLFWSYCLKFYIHLRCSNTHRRRTTPFFSVVSIVTGELNMLIILKYGFKVCVISFGFYLIHYKVYIHLHCINTQWQKTAPFDITHIISSIKRQTPRLYQGSTYCCEVDCNYNIICLIQPYHAIHYCNKSVFAIVPDLTIFVWSIMIFHITSRSALVQFFFITC